MSVCLYLCSIWPAKRQGQSRPNLTHALMSTQGAFLARSMSRSFMYVCGSDRSTKHLARCAKATPGERCSNYVRRTAEATPGERLRNSVQRTGNYSYYLITVAANVQGSGLLFECIKHRLGLRGECLQDVVCRVHSHRRVVLLRHKHLDSSTADSRLPLLLVLLLAPHLLHRGRARRRQTGYSSRRFCTRQSNIQNLFSLRAPVAHCPVADPKGTQGASAPVTPRSSISRLKDETKNYLNPSPGNGFLRRLPATEGVKWPQAYLEF